MKIIRHSKHDVNVGDAERVASALAGGALMYYGIKRRSAGGAGMAVAGGDLIYRGISGHCNLYRLLGIYTGRRSRSTSVPYPVGIRVDKSITINRSPEELFRFWRDPENLARFMHNLESVRKLDDKRSHWIARGPAGKTVEWDAEIINEEPNRRIGWRSLRGADVESGGSVHFDPAPAGRGTVVSVSMQYNPPGGILGAYFAKIFGKEPDQQVQEDLRRFKQLMEAGEVPTTEGQTSGRSMAPTAETHGERRAGHREDTVEHASAESFPASDSPAWSRPEPVHAAR